MSSDLFKSPFSDDYEFNHEMSDLISIDNDEIAGEDGFLDDTHNIQDIVVYSRDWTVETVVTQIEKGNIDLNPEFQRRNAWNDTKKSSLIESYLIGYPVPEIVLAEHPRERRKFIVIDGKQRLLTLCGFLLNEKYGSWKKPRLKGLRDLKDLNGKDFSDLKEDINLTKYIRMLANSDVRCTVISNVNNDDVLYDIFYRLNAGATPLSIQELRQVLYSGPFTKFLIEYTSKLNNFHKVLKLNRPDDRLKDVETVLRVLSFINNINNYNGNLKKHLDNYTIYSNDNWKDIESKIKSQLNDIEEVIYILSKKMKGFENIGRKWNVEKAKMDSRFNTVIFEVQIYFAYHGKEHLKNIDCDRFNDAFNELCEDKNFIASISSSTKNIKEYSVRYELFGEMFKNLTGVNIEYPWK
ncbi:DUF262 domain-containing protein [Grimontia hollisae]|uniref:DUF262 domain-containing protein n=1 Tax=Grimontia hollisae TaxID=673 RepID=UPI0023DB316B|nr:DUF262 domain-containing protein [Grimontia hollisae]MDF2185229.1 DUF262 domain-containing protein [Grimontia hollisae]